MPSPTSLTLNRLRQCGFIACPVERWIESKGIRKDAFGFGDILAANPVRREVLLVQATSTNNISARLKKARAIPELRDWLRAGAGFQVWGWERRAGGWTVKVVAVTGAELADNVLLAPARRGKKSHQPDLFEAFNLIGDDF